MGELGTLDQYQVARSEYLKARKTLIEGLNPKDASDFATAVALAREHLHNELSDLVRFRTQAGPDLGVSLYHSGASPVYDNAQVGDRILLVPGKHNKDGHGAGVYFAESAKTIPFYLKRARKKPGALQTSGAVIVLRPTEVAGIEDFVRFTEGQGPARHSGHSFVEIEVTDIGTLDVGRSNSDVVKTLHAKATRIPATGDEIRKMRKVLGIG